MLLKPILSERIGK
jgi:hypothetical protein